MSALEIRMGNRAVDPSHELEELVQRVQPHLSHLTMHPPVQELIIDLNDQRILATCEPITKIYVMTNKGLAYVRRPLFIFKSTPRLLSHVGISLIEGRDKAIITERLTQLLAQQERIFGSQRLGTV